MLQPFVIDVTFVLQQRFIPIAVRCLQLSPSFFQKPPQCPSWLLPTLRTGQVMGMAKHVCHGSFKALRQKFRRIAAKPLPQCAETFVAASLRRNATRGVPPRHACCHPIVKSKRNPPSGLLATVIVPPCTLTEFFTIASPSPVPPIFRLRPLSMR